MKYKIKYYSLQLNDNYNSYISTPINIYNFIKDEFSPLQEKVILIGLNIKNKILLKKCIAIGGYNTLLIKPSDIFKYVLLANCSNFILSHNHISGEISPSNEDIIFTKKIIKASDIIGLNFLDHIIFNDNKYYSFKQNSLM